MHYDRNSLLTLRELVPVGIQLGMQLLEDTSGDIVAAAEKFRRGMIENVMSAVKTTEEEALRQLLKYNFDSKAAINTIVTDINEAALSYSAFLLWRNSQDQERTLTKIVGRIARIHNWEQKGEWLQLDLIPPMPVEQRCLGIVMEWLDYEFSESLRYAFHFHFDLLQHALCDQLLLNDVADNLYKANTRHLQIFAAYDMTDRRSAINAHNRVESDYEYSLRYKLFRRQRQTIIDTLYCYVAENLAAFP